MINHEIKSDYVNVVSENCLTKMTLDEAINLAEETGEDVILINNNSEIPVVKIMDYNKFIYEKKKREKDKQKKNRMTTQETKEIRISDSIAEHDIMVKAKSIDRILHEGDKVKLVIRYKGRLIRQINEGPDKLRYLASKLIEKYKVDKEPFITGNTVIMVVAPCK